ncbi:MAG: hypothetical protein PHT96_03790 [Syntrophorhabdaceae bacterium]|nr:hypothetical protein [Syntrophorhabdaceae bacterium]
MKKVVRIERHHLTIQVTRSFDYPIPLSELGSPEKLRWWLDHLGGKVWFSAGMKTDMIGLLRQHFGYELSDIARTV